MEIERMIVPIDSLFETHLTVASLDASVAFYRDVLGLELAVRLDERRVAFFWLGERGRSMLGLWETGSTPNTLRLHTAFRCALTDVVAAPDRLRTAGVIPLGFDGEPVIEPVVIGWMPAAAIFFKDPDGHLLEFLAMLPDRPRAEAGVVTYSEWTSSESAGSH
jgi:lactoylglutathione lyase